MDFDAENKIIKMCAEGMEREGQGRNADALELFQQAWNEATDDFERFIAAHYVARHQENVAGKLKWDEISLKLALKINDDNTKEALPSLYLNVAKCHEDLNDFHHARINYTLALSFSNVLPESGYGNMIKHGIEDGLNRISDLA